MIGVLLLTYDRLEVAKITLESVALNLISSEPIWLHVADDGSSQEYRDELVAMAHSFYGDNVSVTNAQRSGYGGNYNAATQVLHQAADVILPLEDDWQLVRPLEIDKIAAVLRANVFGCVRLGYMGYTDELRGVLRYHEGIHWLELDPSSPEKHVFAGGPRMESVGWERVLGPWPEHLEQGFTELEVAGRVEARQAVAWPVDLVSPKGDAFVHIGAVKAGSEDSGSAAKMQVA